MVTPSESGFEALNECKFKLLFKVITEITLLDNVRCDCFMTLYIQYRNMNTRKIKHFFTGGTFANRQ